MQTTSINPDVPVKLSDYEPLTRSDGSKTMRKVFIVNFSTKVGTDELPSRIFVTIEEGLVIRDRVQALVDKYNSTHSNKMVLASVDPKLHEITTLKSA